MALFNRHYREKRHYSTCTINSSGPVQPALKGEKALFNPHYEEQWYYSTGTTGSSGTIQPARQEAEHYSTGTTGSSDTICRHFSGGPHVNPLTFGHPLGGRYAGVVEVSVEHDDAERQDKRRIRVRENRSVLPDSIRSVGSRSQGKKKNPRAKRKKVNKRKKEKNGKNGKNGKNDGQEKKKGKHRGTKRRNERRKKRKERNEAKKRKERNKTKESKERDGRTAGQTAGRQRRTIGRGTFMERKHSANSTINK